MLSLLLHWAFNAVALWVAAYFLTGLDFNGDMVRLLLVAAVFGIVNSLLRPILTVLTFWPAFWGGLVVGLVSLMLSLLIPKPEN